MPIDVICPGCHARFKVSDRFAGKSGACPKCHASIRVPAPDEQVKVHVPEQFGGGRGRTGRLLLRPIVRQRLKFSPISAAAVLVAVAAAVAGAWLAGAVLRQYWIVRAAAVLLVSPPLALGGYLLLRDEESLETFSGRPLAIRTTICAVAYAMLWGVFGYVSTFAFSEDVWSWLVVAPPFLVSGALIAHACYDLDFGTGFLHYAFYLLVTILLRGCAGLGWIWHLGRMG